ncbi:MAG: hypothetical protein GX236_07225 [Clostridiaceae bacterium]|jgi:hypothetical protein|nr:hypothetical protein [Desulfitobacteriaceae bacterium]NLL67473.1 hypothetical protein [Clostridiaceae bacterium]
MSILILEDDEPQFIWDTVNNLQLAFHPIIAPEGIFDYKSLTAFRHSKNVAVFFDRNLLSSFLKLCKQGFLNDEKEMRIIALLMTWILMHQFSISPGLAIKENAVKSDDNIIAKTELKQFNEAFDFYPSMMWLRLAQGEIDTIPPFKFSGIPFETQISYHREDDHLLMHLASMLHVVYLYRRKDLSPLDKVISFLKWNCKYLLICKYTNTYITMLFTNQEGIRPPKGVNSNRIEIIMNGCYNQAWDLNYLSNWSTLYYDEERQQDAFIFATADVMLKRIFINTHGGGNYFNLIDAIFPAKQAQKIVDFYEQQLSPNNRNRPNFGDNPTQYFKDLIKQEKNRLHSFINT